MQEKSTISGSAVGYTESPQSLYRATLLKRCLLLLAFIVGGGLFGRAISLIPSPSEVTMFWVSNLSSPWLVLAFLAGWSQRSRLWAAGTGALADVASIVGFYGQFLFIGANPGGPLIRATPLVFPLVFWLEYNLSHWLHFVAPWVLIAIVTGAAYGLLGYWWGRHRSIVAGALVALPFIAEPWLWRIYLGYYKGPLILWIAEVALGVALLVWVIRVWATRHRRVTTIL
ncbi:MAG: hypothetical protein ACXWQR_17085 [Ktedonobacterales bacterium]